MNVIKNIHKLPGSIPSDQLDKLEAGARLHLRYSNISFKILEQKDRDIIIRVEQGKSASGNYADVKTLIQGTHDLFDGFLLDHDVKVHAFPYAGALVDVVTPNWIKDKMLHKSVKIKDMVTDTGIPKSSFSNWISGGKEMSQIVKAMFYFYLTR